MYPRTGVSVLLALFSRQAIKNWRYVVLVFFINCPTSCLQNTETFAKKVFLLYKTIQNLMGVTTSIKLHVFDVNASTCIKAME